MSNATGTIEVSSGRWGTLCVRETVGKRLIVVTPRGHVDCPIRQASGWIAWDRRELVSQELQRRARAEFERQRKTGQHYANDYKARCDYPQLAGEPREWTENQQEQAITFYVGLRLRDLRRRQAICHGQLSQLGRIPESLRERGYSNLETIRRLLAAAVDRQQFPG